MVHIELDHVKDFDPLKEAVALPDNPVKVEITKPLKVSLMGTDYNLAPGQTELPLYAAVFAAGRKAATVLN